MRPRCGDVSTALSSGGLVAETQAKPCYLHCAQARAKEERSRKDWTSAAAGVDALVLKDTDVHCTRVQKQMEGEVAELKVTSLGEGSDKFEVLRMQS